MADETKKEDKLKKAEKEVKKLGSKVEKKGSEVAQEVRALGEKIGKNTAEKRLYRSGKDKIIAGVCGGLGEYFGIDPVIVRILWIVLTLVSFGLGILLYLLSWLVIPRNPGHSWP